MRLFSRRLTVALAATAGATIALMTPGIAQAAPPVVTGATQQGAQISLNGGKTEETALWGLKVDGKLLQTYCVESNQPATAGSQRTEKPWTDLNGKGPKADPAKMLWILHHSYPTVTTAKLEADMKAAGVGILDNISAQEAIAGTQAAIWHFSESSTMDKNANEDINGVYTYLTTKNPGLAATTPQLSITPATATVKAGENAGPFTIKTNAKEATITLTSAEQATLVDAEGNPVGQTVQNGANVFVKTPADAAGQAAIDVAAEWNLQTGRYFVSPTKQDLVSPEVKKDKKTAKANAEWTFTQPTPTPTVTPSAPGSGGELPKTGSGSVLPITLAGAGLLAVGAVVVFMARRRKVSTIA